MNILQLTALYSLLFTNITLSGQANSRKSFIAIGVSAIPLHIERTDLTRWMVFPSIDFSYKLNEKVLIHASYLYQDLRTYFNSTNGSSKYIETPTLNSFELASMYLGDKYTLSLFSNYCFLGMQYEHFNTDVFALRSGVDLGFRFGETNILDEIHESWYAPYGYKAQASIQTSDSPGLKLSLSPRLKFWKFLYFESSIGTYIFINWPVVQPFGCIQIGLVL